MCPTEQFPDQMNLDLFFVLKLVPLPSKEIVSLNKVIRPIYIEHCLKNEIQAIVNEFHLFYLIMILQEILNYLHRQYA